MKIAWFAPLSNSSAIGRFSVAVAEQLRSFSEIDLYSFDAGELRQTSVPIKVFGSAREIPPRILTAYDAIVYNFGNYLPFHREIFELARQQPGICILHDFVMHHFFAGYYLDYRHDSAAYQSALARCCEEAPTAEARIWQTDEVVKYPLFEEVTRYALAVITHSEFFRVKVESVFPGPVTRIPLAYTAAPQCQEASRRQLGIRDEELLMLTVGHVNPNKQVETVLRALAQVREEAPSMTYAVLGSVSASYLRRLELMVLERQLGGIVRFFGEVPDRLLEAFLSASDICINLRVPATEGASASVIEEMLFSKPVIVTDTGFFSELPDDCVIKVRPNSDSDLTNALRLLMHDAQARLTLGRKARAFAESEFSPDQYAKRLVDFAWEVRSAKPLLELSDRLAGELCKMGVRRDMSIVERVANEINQMFVGNSPRSSQR